MRHEELLADEMRLPACLSSYFDEIEPRGLKDPFRETTGRGRRGHGLYHRRVCWLVRLIAIPQRHGLLGCLSPRTFFFYHSLFTILGRELGALPGTRTRLRADESPLANLNTGRTPGIPGCFIAGSWRPGRRGRGEEKGLG